jgi:hypothetical protein
MIVSFNHI